MWEEEFLSLREKASWIEVLNFLKQFSTDDHNNVKIYVEAIYYLLDILLYAKYSSRFEHDEIANALQKLFDESYVKFNEDAEYLFFVGHFMALAEWYFGQNDLNLSQHMQKRAKELEPGNILYEWAYKSSTFDSNYGCLAEQLLSTASILKWLKSRGAAGNHMIEIIETSSRFSHLEGVRDCVS